MSVLDFNGKDPSTANEPRHYNINDVVLYNSLLSLITDYEVNDGVWSYKMAHTSDYVPQSDIEPWLADEDFIRQAADTYMMLAVSRVREANCQAQLECAISVTQYERDSSVILMHRVSVGGYGDNSVAIKGDNLLVAAKMAGEDYQKRVNFEPKRINVLR